MSDLPETQGKADDNYEVLHASSVAHNGRAVLILGKSGSGKSTLALQLMALGAGLISDDRTILRKSNGVITAASPASISGLIEARGVGILKAEPAGETSVFLAIDLDLKEVERLPEYRSRRFLGHSVPLLASIPGSHFPAAILQYLAYGRQEN